MLGANDSISEDTNDRMYNANQRVVYTNGVESYLMKGDPEQRAERYSEGRVLPMLLLEGWRIVSVTPASNAESGPGKTLVVLEIPVPPYDHQLTIREGEQAHFPGTNILVAVGRKKVRRPNPDFNPNAEPPDPGGPFITEHAIFVSVFWANERLEQRGILLNKVWDLKNGYSLQVVNSRIVNEIMSLTIRLFSN